MLDSRVTGEVLAEARRARAKVILAGDDRQLASIERGGLFSELRQRHGSAEISEITGQRVNRHPKLTPYRRPKLTPLVAACAGRRYWGRAPRRAPQVADAAVPR